jgi:hypothetical protein
MVKILRYGLVLGLLLVCRACIQNDYPGSSWRRVVNLKFGLGYWNAVDPTFSFVLDTNYNFTLVGLDLFTGYSALAITPRCT